MGKVCVKLLIMILHTIHDKIIYYTDIILVFISHII